MKAIYRNMQGLMVAMLLTAGFASCANDHSTDTANVTQGNGTLTLNIHSDAVGMRAATTITDGGTTTTATDNEKTINDVTFGVFKAADGNLKGDVTRATTPTASTAGYTQEFGTNVAESDKFSVGDSVILAINIPTAVNFSGVSTKDGFYGITLTAEQALTYGTGTVDATKLPKFGKSVLAADGTSGNFTADVTVRHLVAKVSLAQLTVDFDDDNAHNGHAAFTPEEVFLYQVPNQLGLQLDENGKYVFAAGVAPTSYLQGESSTSSDATFADYLGTGALGAAQMTTGNMANTYTFYTMPNQAGKSDLAAANRTRLIIKGKYTEDKDRDATGHTAYYAINLGTTADYEVEANNHYIVTATIKGDGASTVNGTIPNIQNLITTVTVSDWEEEATAVTVAKGGYHYIMPADYSNIQIGDIIYADGHYNSSYDADFATAHGEPIAIVFSTTPTVYDQDEAQNGIGNFTHGYAMALKRANSGAATAGWCAGVSSLRTTQVTDVMYHSTDVATQWQNITTDMEGLKHCNTARKYCTVNSIDESNLLAIMAAVNYTTAPVNTTWYLPSIGQQYQWLVQFAKSWTNYATVMVDRTKWYVPLSGDGGFLIDYSIYAGASANIATAINTYLTDKGLTAGTTFEAFAQGHYLWSSTERAANYPFILTFNNSGDLRLHGSSLKSESGDQVRAVLAF